MITLCFVPALINTQILPEIPLIFLVPIGYSYGI